MSAENWRMILYGLLNIDQSGMQSRWTPVMRCYGEVARAWARPFDRSFGVEWWWSVGHRSSVCDKSAWRDVTCACSGERNGTEKGKCNWLVLKCWCGA
jgi:hypothetical protein